MNEQKEMTAKSHLLCNITILFIGRRANRKFRRGCKGVFFKRQHLPLGERKTCLQVAFLIAISCQKCFSVTLGKSNRTTNRKREDVIKCRERLVQ